MGKILDFSSAFEEATIDHQLKCIQKELLQNHLSCKKLHSLALELNSIYHLIDDNLSKQIFLTDRAFEQLNEKKYHVGSLLNSCYHKWLDRKIDHLTENAQKISQTKNLSEKKTSKKIDMLKKELHVLCENNALSLENKYLIKIAKKCLSKKEIKEKNSDKFHSAKTLRVDFSLNHLNKDDLIDVYDICLSLYEIAGNFFHHKFNEAFDLFFSLPQETRNHITQKLNEKEANINNLKTIQNFNKWQTNLFVVVQTLTAFANQLIDGSKESQELDDIEIQSIFNDPFFRSSEKVDNF